ncbi:MAG TPA: FHA domain-containing protein [Oscillatoriaceae cyanobacterium]
MSAEASPHVPPAGSSTPPAWLVEVRSGRRYPLTPVTTIGRRGEIACGDPYMSRRHAEIRGDARGYWLRDLESVNGSYHGANGGPQRPVLAPTRLRHGDLITLGTTALAFEAPGDADV